MRSALAAAALAALLLAGAALAAGEPKKRITKADQARAQAMLLKRADVGLGYRPLPHGTDTSLNCAALDESDLTVTGEAFSPNFSSSLQAISSVAAVYISESDSNASWRRETSKAGFTCLSNAFREVSRANGARFVSFRKIPFPAVAPRTAAYRWRTLASGVRVYADIVFLMRSRAQAAVYFVSGIDPVDQPERLQLARLVSGRMAKAMRGA